MNTVQKKRKFLRASRFIGKWSISRLIRWAIFLTIAYWVGTNWHESLPLDVVKTKWMDADSHWVEIEGMQVHYRMTGKGNPLLLLHDESSSLQTWKGWADTLSAGYQVISVDLPGFGLTGPNPRGSYSTFMYADFLERLIDTLHLKKTNLAGVGLGAQIAWFYAAENPEKVDKLILMDAPGFEKQGNTWVQYLAQTPILNKVLLRITPVQGVKLMLQRVYADDRLVTDELVNRYFELVLRPGNRKAYTDYCSVRSNRPPEDFIERIKNPTLILWGAEDALISTQHAYDFHKRVKGSLLKIYRHAGHWPQEENPSETAHDVRAFLEGKF